MILMKGTGRSGCVFRFIDEFNYYFVSLSPTHGYEFGKSVNGDIEILK